MIKTKKFSDVAKVLKGIAAVASVQYGGVLIESDIKIDIADIKKTFSDCGGKDYGFSVSIGIRALGTNNSLGSMFRDYLEDGDFKAIYNIDFDNIEKVWKITKTDSEHCYM